jgi:hypothetical protein
VLHVRAIPKRSIGLDIARRQVHELASRTSSISASAPNRSANTASRYRPIRAQSRQEKADHHIWGHIGQLRPANDPLSSLGFPSKSKRRRKSGHSASLNPFGPAIGGVIVASAGAVAAFITNALLYLPLLIVLFFWRRLKEPSRLPAERAAIPSSAISSTSDQIAEKWQQWLIAMAAIPCARAFY